jgi:hypothetical protein
MKIKPEQIDTKTPNEVSIKLPKTERGEILNLYLKVRAEDTKNGGVIMTIVFPE